MALPSLAPIFVAFDLGSQRLEERAVNQRSPGGGADQIPPMATEPLLGAPRIRAQTLQHQPKLRGMVRHYKVHNLVSHDVAKDRVGRHDQAPIEREIAPRRAVAPLGSLTHDVDVDRTVTYPGRDSTEMIPDLPAGLATEPQLEAARRGRSGTRPPRHDYRAVHDSDQVPCIPRLRGFKANPGWFPTKEYLPGKEPSSATNSLQPFSTLKLVEHPAPVRDEELRRLLATAVLRVENLHTARPDPHPELAAALRPHEPVVHHASTKLDLVLG